MALSITPFHTSMLVTSSLAQSPWCQCTWDTKWTFAGTGIRLIFLMWFMIVYYLHNVYTIHRYKDYRDPPWSDTPYEFSREFWAILAARLAFVIVFQVSQNQIYKILTFLKFLIKDEFYKEISRS